jgi:hypothetical protein
MKNKFLSSIFSAVFVFAIASNADMIKLTGIGNGSSESVSIVGSDQYLGGPNYSGGVLTGLYNALNETTNEAWLTYCIDPIGEIALQNSWNANLTTGAQLSSGNAGVLSTLAYSSGLSAGVTIEKYQMISYLADKYYYDLTTSNPMANTNNSDAAISARSDLSLAFWEISRDFDGNSSSLNLGNGKFMAYGDVSFAQGLVNEAYNNHNHSSAIDLMVFTPTQRPSQEFIAFRPVPEPGILSLIGITLLSMLGFAKFRRKK